MIRKKATGKTARGFSAEETVKFRFAGVLHRTKPSPGGKVARPSAARIQRVG